MCASVDSLMRLPDYHFSGVQIEVSGVAFESVAVGFQYRIKMVHMMFVYCFFTYFQLHFHRLQGVV